MPLQDKFPVHERYLKKCNLHITGGMRAILINWLMQVHARFQLLPETLFLTVSVMDRFLQVRTIGSTDTLAILLPSKLWYSRLPLICVYVL